MLATICAALLIGYLPGALIYRIPDSGREHRSRLPADERCFWAVVLSVVWSHVVVLLLAATGRYQFERVLAVNAAVVGLVVLVWRTGLLYQGTAAACSRAAVVPAVLVAAGLWLYFPPSEYVLGGKDPGTYLNEGVQIAQRGNLVIHDGVIAAVPGPLRDLFFPSHEVPSYYGLRFMGFFIQNPDRGLVIGQFPHLFPISIALGYGLNGLSGARQAVGAWAILGLLATYFTGTRLFGRLSGAIAAFLLAINVMQVWFARYPNSELATQAMVFAAVLAFARAREGGQVFFGALAGMLLGLQLFLRFDAILAIAAFCMAAMITTFARERVGWSFGTALVLTAAPGLWYLAVAMQAYSVGYFEYLLNQRGPALFGTGLLVLWLVQRRAHVEPWAAFIRRAAPLTLASVVVALAVYGYFFRQPGGRLAPADAAAFRAFAWYVTPFGLAAAVTAFGIFATTRFWRDPAFFLTLAAHSIFFFYKARIVPEHFWMARRFLSVILPGALICVGGLIAAGASARPDRGLRGRALRAAGLVSAIAAVVLLGTAFVRASVAIRTHVEYAGVIPRLERIAARIGDRDLVVVESRNSSEVHILALPLAYIYARNVLVLGSPTPDREAFENFAAWAENHYSNLLFLAEGGTDLLTRRMRAEPLATEHFEVPEYESALNAYPATARLKKFGVSLYRLSRTTETGSEPVVVTLGREDDLNVLRFHSKERSADGVPYRWSRDVSYVLIPWSPGARRVTIWMRNGGRPGSAPPPIVDVALDDHPLGTATPTDAWEPFTFDVQPATAAGAAALNHAVRLRLRVATWNPHKMLQVADDRDLGVMVSRVEVR